MKELIFCEFNIDTGCVEAKFSDGSMIAVNWTAVENEVADNMYERLELDWLVYNAPVDYINLVLIENVELYLRNVTGFYSVNS